MKKELLDFFTKPLDKAEIVLIISTLLQITFLVGFMVGIWFARNM